MNSQNNTLFNRSFIGLNVAQVLGALNDNIFKLFVVFALIKLGAAADSSRVLALEAMRSDSQIIPHSPSNSSTNCGSCGAGMRRTSNRLVTPDRRTLRAL